MKGLIRVSAALAVAISSMPANAQVVFSGSGSNSAAIQPTVDAFRTALGGGTTAGANGSFSDGTGARREINWDGVPDALAAPNNLPANFFNVNSPRGAVFSTPGTGFQVSANAGVGPVQFDNINPSYSSLFATFSAQRIFTAVGSNVLDVNFFLPGTSTPALVDGFGAVFSDVDLVNSTSLSLYDLNNSLLGTWNVLSSSGNETMSFLGILFGTPTISRVRITSGNTALGPNESAGVDLVAMDDFIFGEPTRAAAVPEPASWAMLLTGFGLIGIQLRRRPRRATGLAKS